MKLSYKLSLVNSHGTLVLFWPGHESWWNYSHANPRLQVNSHAVMQLLFSFDQDIWQLMKLSCKLSLVNSHATLVLIRQGRKVDETLMQVLVGFSNSWATVGILFVRGTVWVHVSQSLCLMTTLTTNDSTRFLEFESTWSGVLIYIWLRHFFNSSIKWLNFKWGVVLSPHWPCIHRIITFPWLPVRWWLE